MSAGAYKSKALNVPSYEVQQSHFQWAPRLPLRAAFVSPSGGGKTTTLVNMILDVYDGCFGAICVFSHSVHLDSIWGLSRPG